MNLLILIINNKGFIHYLKLNSKRLLIFGYFILD